MSLPAATERPCSDCPWRRVSIPGWLGPYDAETWLLIVHSDEPIACHETIVTSASWEGALQCRGAAIFRENTHKSPRDREVVTGPADERRVFASSAEFREHHSR